jgi:hypothetical protein
MLRSFVVCWLLLCLCFSGQAGKRGLIKRKLLPSKAQRTRSSGDTVASTARHEPSITDVLARKFLENKVSAKDIHEKLKVCYLLVAS